MSETKTYAGGCHCGKVRYEAQTDLSGLVSCNCSMCSKMGWILTFVPGPQFKLLQGEDALVDYQFNKHVIHHVFCKHCGVKSFSHGTNEGGQAYYAVNVRCLDDVDVASLDVQSFDGKSR